MLFAGRVNRRAFLRTGAVSTAILWAAPTGFSEDRLSAPSDSELLAEGRSSIEGHRKADITIHVQNSKGQPLPGATVRLEQLRHEFLFGCNLFLLGRCPDPEQEEMYRKRFAALFNYCTLGFYWASFEAQRGKPNFDYIDRVLEWTRQQGIICKGHPLVWDHPAGSPRWLPDDPSEIAALVLERVKNIASRYRGRIDIWDVVNEATHLPDGANKTKMAAWGASLGPVPYAGEPLKIARDANLSATLLINDYRTDPPYYQILSRLRDEKGFLFDAVGIQSHMHDGLWPLHKVYSICETYSKLHLPIHFTETTILSGGREKRTDAWGPTTADSEVKQAEQAINFYTILFASPAVHALTWWDFSDYHAWQAAPAGLVRDDMSPKPAYEFLLKLIKQQWWTDSKSHTDLQGTCQFRAYHGNYRASAELSDKQTAASEVHVQRGRTNEITLTI